MKYLVIVANGLTDQPIAEKDNRTPLQLADVPNLDRLACEGRTGSVRTIPENLHAGGDVAYLSVLGYAPETYYASPASFEMLELGVSLKDGEIPLCCDFVTLQASHNDMVMKDFTAGHLSDEHSKMLLDALQEKVAEVDVAFHKGAGHHNLMVLKSSPFNARLTPPHELVGEGIRNFMPSDGEFKDLVFLMNQAQIILHNHPFNQRRKMENKDMVNSVWLWGNGKAGSLPRFLEQHNKNGSVITASVLMKGMARSAGMNVVPVEGATGFSNTNYSGKVDAALAELDRSDVVYLHVAAAEDVSLKGDIDDKVLVLEDIDREVIGPCLEAIEGRSDVKVMVLVSHVCSANLLKYSKDNVPFIVYPATNAADAVDRFDEKILDTGSDHFKDGPSLMSAFFKDSL